MALYFVVCYAAIAAMYITIWVSQCLWRGFMAIIRRGGRSRADGKVSPRPAQCRRSRFRTWHAVWIVVLLIPVMPYVYDQIVSLVYLPHMQNAIRAGVRAIGLQQPIRFQKVIWVLGNRARVYVVAGARNDIEGDRVELRRSHGVWNFDGLYGVAFSERWCVDDDVIPPYPALGDF